MITGGQIVNKLVETILAQGYSIALEAEGEPFLDATRDKDEILRNVDASTFITIVIVQEKEVGYFLIIWGNDEDIISDYSDNGICRQIDREVTDALGL